jgi:hypothetical protein
MLAIEYKKGKSLMQLTFNAWDAANIFGGCY